MAAWTGKVIGTGGLGQGQGQSDRNRDRGNEAGTGTEPLTLKTQHCCGFHGSTHDWQTTVY